MCIFALSLSPSIGYHGKFCEIDVDECENNPCMNGATCINEAGSFRCLCPPELKSCGDPLYSNFSISNLIYNASLEMKILALVLILALAGIMICFCCYICCCRGRRGRRKSSREDVPSVVCKNNEASPINATATEYKRVSKMSNLEAVQHQVRPTSYSTGVPDNHHNVSYNPIMQYTNNLDSHRNYTGSASEELEALPPEFRKLNHNPMMIQQMVNLNNIQSLANTTTSSDPTDTSTHKQNKWDQIHLQTFNDKTKINNDKRLGAQPHHHHHHHHGVKQGGILQGRLLPSPAATYAGTTENAGAYDWDVSDWKPRSLNVLSNITEVPGSEVVDSSSFHSNESNESHTLRTNNIIPAPNGMMDSMTSSVDQLRNGGMLSENLEIDFPDLSSECDRNGSENPLSITSMSQLNHLDSSDGENYRFNAGKMEIYIMFSFHIVGRFSFSCEWAASIFFFHSHGEDARCTVNLSQNQCLQTRTRGGCAQFK